MASEVEEFENARIRAAAITQRDPETADILKALIDKGKRFQELWLETTSDVREYEVKPMRQRLKELQDLLATDSIERMEEALRIHYKEPVRPVSHYCKAFEDWGNVLRERLAEIEKEPEEHAENCNSIKNPPPGGYCNCARYWSEQDKRWMTPVVEALNHLQLPIRKSNLLFRLIYLGEPLRTEKCPEHKGHWTGCWFDRSCDCQSGYDVTGWLPTPKSEAG